MNTQDATTQSGARAWHSMETDDVRAALQTDLKSGLTREEAQNRLIAHGANVLPDPVREGLLRRLLRQFHNVLIYVLIAAAAITAAMGHWIDTLVIAAVVVINALIGFIQEGRAERALEGIRRMLSLEARVIRDGERRSIDAEKLVPGDLIELRSGDRVPADVRLVHARDLRIEESALTGESVPAGKSTAAVHSGAVPGDRKGVAFSGTMRRPPRPPSASILDGHFVWRVAFVSAIIAGLTFALHGVALSAGASTAAASAVAVNTLVAGQVFYLLNCRSTRVSSIRLSIFDNRAVPLTIAILLVLQALFTFAPVFQTAFGTAAPEPWMWGWIALAGLVVFVLARLSLLDPLLG